MMVAVYTVYVIKLPKQEVFMPNPSTNVQNTSGYRQYSVVRKVKSNRVDKNQYD